MRQEMQFANGSTARSRGSINLKVAFGGDGSPPNIVLELVDTLRTSSEQLQSPPEGSKVNYSAQFAIAAEFHVLENLQVEVLLGVDVLAIVDAFVQHNREFTFNPVRNLHNLFLTEQLSGIALAWANNRPQASTSCSWSGIN
jgi:hypothetical protein